MSIPSDPAARAPMIPESPREESRPPDTTYTAPTATMSDGLSFERDIQPLSKRLFRKAFGTIKDPHLASAMFQKINKGLQQSYVDNSALEKTDDHKRIRALEFEKSTFALEVARDTARRKNQMHRDLAPVQDLLNDIISDPETNHADKVRGIGLVGVNHAAGGPAISAAVRNATNALGTEVRPYTVKNYTGPPEYLELVQERLGYPLALDTPLDLVEAKKFEATWLRNRTLSKAEQAQQAKQEERRYKLVVKASELELEKKDLAGDPDRLPPGATATLAVVVKSYGTAAEIAEFEASTKDPAHQLELGRRISNDTLIHPDSRPLNPPPGTPGSASSDIIRLGE